MHQHPRPSPTMASPALSPRTNPTRTNNPREEGLASHSRPGSEIQMYNDADEASGDSGLIAVTGPSPEAIIKLDQIIQNFYTKAAVIILQSRMELEAILTKERKSKKNRWFQIETDETSDFRRELSLWRASGGFHNRPPPMIIETFIDTSTLTSNQSLVIVDESGKRCDVLEALNSRYSGSSDGANRSRKRSTEVILERWKIELQDGSDEQPTEFASTLPTIYKKCIVFFRSLFAITKFLPAYKFAKAMSKRGSSQNYMKLKCRILVGDNRAPGFDSLSHPLYDHKSPVTTEYSLGMTDTPAGKFCAELSYRNDCNFRVDDSEALLSSRFMGADEDYFQPSLGINGIIHRQTTKPAEIGSLPAHRHVSEDLEPVQAYGSLSTFHGNVPAGASSPISALRAQRPIGSDVDADSPPTSAQARNRPLSIQASRGSLRSVDGGPMGRRPSVSFQPFKAGSLSSSPGRAAIAGEMGPPQSPQSLPRSGFSALTQPRNRSSLTAGMPASLRGGPVPSDNIPTASTSSSPKPTPISRYSSSFTHRRGRSSFGGGSKITVDDDQGSSGKQSLSSSVQPGSGILAEGTGTSSGSLQADDDNISDFLKLLDSKKTLQSFAPSNEGSSKRTSAQLSKFQSMRESNNALTESMTSSTMLHRSSSSSSRQLSSVPPMVAANSMSVSSSPGKPISPHTPHTPAIPSRLSANSIVDYSVPRQQHMRTTGEHRLTGVVSEDQPNILGTNAIDIPTSPRTYYQHTRRSSSVAQQHRNLPVDDDVTEIPFGVHRSISLGANDREAPSLAALLGQNTDNAASTSSTSPSRVLQPAPHISETSVEMSRQPSSSLDANELEAPAIPRGLSAGSANSPYKPRIGRTGGRGVTPPQTGSYSSLVSGSGGASDRGGGRYSFTRNPGTYEADDEPLLFDMSEIGRDQGRRSIEEPRGGGSAGASHDRGGFDATSSNSRRGSWRRP